MRSVESINRCLQCPPPPPPTPVPPHPNCPWWRILGGIHSDSNQDLNILFAISSVFTCGWDPLWHFVHQVFHIQIAGHCTKDACNFGNIWAVGGLIGSKCFGYLRYRRATVTRLWLGMSWVPWIELFQYSADKGTQWYAYMLVYQIYTKLAFCFCHYQHTARYAIVCTLVLEK